MKTTWQDLSFTIGGFFFTLALLPSLIGPDKPAPWTSLITGLILLEFCLVYRSLRLRLSLISGFLTAVAWLTLYAQVVGPRVWVGDAILLLTLPFFWWLGENARRR